MAADSEERLQAEIELLEAMYPDQIHYASKLRELKYTSEQNAILAVILPSGYLQDELPTILSASSDGGKQDLRNQLKQHVQSLTPGEEVLDSLVSTFTELAAASEAPSRDLTSSPIQGLLASKHAPTPPSTTRASLTVIIYLHHLLNTHKRKLALSPPPGISGVTKPGYPGVLIYSGPAEPVRQHVTELKGENWQAFQVRFEGEEEWIFGGNGVREVETMGEVVKAVGEERKEVFMGAMRMK